MTAAVRPISDRHADRWDAFVEKHPQATALAASRAQAYWQAGGWSPQYFAAYDGEMMQAGLAMIVKKIPLVPYSLARIVAMLADGGQATAMAGALLGAAERFARDEGIAEIESRCRVFSGVDVSGVDYSKTLRQALEQSGFEPRDVTRGTYLVRIDVDDETLLKSFSSKCRRDVRKGVREGVAVEESGSEASFRYFCDTTREMVERKVLEGVSPVRFDTFWPMVEKGYYRLFLAKYDGQTCNMALVDALGIPMYAYGATSEAAFEKGVPPTGQPLHHAIMRWFRDRGAAYYDLGGSPGPDPQKGHPNYPVWRFKHEFQGQYVRTIPWCRRPMSLVGRVLASAMRRLGRLQ